MGRFAKRFYLHTVRALTGPFLLPPLIGAWLAHRRLDNRWIAGRLRQRATANGGTLSLAVVGDTHLENDGAADLHQAVADFQPEAILHLGDYADEGGLFETLRHVANWDLMHQTQHQGLLHVLGNHDKRTFGRFWFERLFGPSRIALDLGMWRLAILDNSEHPGFSAADVAWLEQLAAKPQPTVLAFHKPPRTERWPRHGAELPAGIDLWGAARRAGVRLALCGHCHVYDEQEIDGIRVILTGGGSLPGSDLGFGTPGRHLLKLVLPGDGTQPAQVHKIDLRPT